MKFKNKTVMKRSGKVQMVYKPTQTSKEQNWTYDFSNFWQLVKLIWKAYRNNANKTYIFFNQ